MQGVETVSPKSNRCHRLKVAAQSRREFACGVVEELTVPFALAVGLSGSIPWNWMIVGVCLAEVACAATLVFLSRYLLSRGTPKVRGLSPKEVADLDELDSISALLNTLSRTPLRRDRPVEPSMMLPRGSFPNRQSSDIPLPDCELRSHQSAAVRGLPSSQVGETVSPGTRTLAVIVGGVVPILPYAVFASVDRGLIASIVATAMTILTISYSRLGTPRDPQPWSEWTKRTLTLCRVFIAAILALAAVMMIRLH